MSGQTSYSNPCPVCGARPFTQCRSLTLGLKTDTHARRLNGEWPAEPVDNDAEDQRA